MKRLRPAPATLLLTATIAIPCAAQQAPSMPLPNQDCAACFAYLEFSPSLEPESHAMRSQAIEPAPSLPAADAPGDRVRELAKMTNLAKPERCPAELVDVTAESREERHLACSAAGDAIQLLDRCGISLRRPLQVHIMNEVRHPSGGSIFGLFDTKRERVLIAQEANLPALVKDTPYAMLPRREFYRSLVVHEVVHGVMHQNLKRPATTHAAHEYPAYALQIESLAPHAREAFLKSFDQTAIANKSLFNDTVLFFDPFFFAASAHHHFKGSANGCAYLTALLEGDVSFIAPPQM